MSELPGTTLNDEISQEEKELLENEKLYQEDEQKQAAFKLPAWVTAQTGDGSVESYLDHTLNFNKSMGLARIIRGLTGIFQNGLNFALVDIVIGFSQFMKDKKGAAAVGSTN